LLSDSERAIVHDGALAKRLLEYEEWMAFVRAVGELKGTMVARSLQKGDTDFEKGAVFAIDLVMGAPRNTIEERERLLAREASLSESEREGTKEVKSEVSP
jgi:hypothetical protein